MGYHVLMQAVPMGLYVSPYKLVVVLAVTIIWWRLLTWLDKDSDAARLPREWANLGMAGAYILGIILFLYVPIFLLAFAIYLLIFLGSFGAYLAIRSQQVGLKDLLDDLKSLKILQPRAATAEQDVPGMVALATRDGRHMTPPASETPERQSYDLIQMMITEPLRRNMERLELTPIEGAVLTQYWVDGVVYNGAQFNRAGAQAAITTLKHLAGLDVNERRKPQTGTIQASVEGHRHEVEVTTAGSTSGESLRLRVDPRKRHQLRLDQLGLSEVQLHQVDAVVKEEGGVVLCAVPKGQGLTSLLYGIVRQHDAFLTHIHSIEREPEIDLEGVTQNKLARGVSPADELQSVQWVISQEPDTILVPEIQNPKSLRELIAYAGKGKRIYIGLRSGSAIDAINDFRTMVGADDLAMKNLRMVIAGRVVRKLCDACKQPYQPDAETLRKLNLDHGRAQQFFQARLQPMTDQKGNPIFCTFCHELRYRGRVGVFEVMDIGEDFRQAVLASASVNQLRALFRKSRGRFIQEQALDLVEAGKTSIQEVLRAMRGQEQDPNVARAAAGGTGTFMASGTAAGQGTRSGTQGGQTRFGRPPTGR